MFSILSNFWFFLLLLIIVVFSVVGRKYVERKIVRGKASNLMFGNLSLEKWHERFTMTVIAILPLFVVASFIQLEKLLQIIFQLFVFVVLGS